MIKIIKIDIKRFRSILSLEVNVDSDNNLLAICGQNNVGKTNFLRAIRLFFCPDYYEQSEDIPQIKVATGGQSVHPKITIDFLDTNRNLYFAISRDMKDFSESSSGLKGYSYKLVRGKHNNKSALSDEDIKQFLSSIEFVYVDSINVFMPTLIANLSDDMINIKYDNTRFTESKKALKESYETYIDGLQAILDAFASDISGTFKRFNENWQLKFIVPKNSNSFKDLISDDVKLSITDNGSQSVIAKGAGLQRLTAILLFFEMIKRLKKRKQAILCIDEPDVYLHEGLQKKLKNLFDENSAEMQIFYTTHSKIFINPYSLKNLVLLDSKNYQQFSTRKHKKIDVTETFSVELSNDEGYNKICTHLGIEQTRFEVLQRRNILVEGDCDKKYLSELGCFFDYELPNIISLHGADQSSKYLEFYESYYKGNTDYIPKIKLLLDNDAKGREVFAHIRKKHFDNISVECVLLQNFSNSSNLALENNSTNNEIEDFLYPEVLCYLVNGILLKKKFNKINEASICRNIKQKSFNSKGILELCEHEKNLVNPERGAEISFCSSNKATNQFKEGLAGLFNIQGNHRLQTLIYECDIKYPTVKIFLRNLFNFT